MDYVDMGAMQRRIAVERNDAVLLRGRHGSSKRSGALVAVLCVDGSDHQGPRTGLPATSLHVNASTWGQFSP